MAAGELLAHRLDHLPAARDHLQRLGHVLADLRQLLQSAARAGSRRRHHHALARQVRRERLAARKPLDLRGPRRRLFGRQLVLGRARLKLVELRSSWSRSRCLRHRPARSPSVPPPAHPPRQHPTAAAPQPPAPSRQSRQPARETGAASGHQVGVHVVAPRHNRHRNPRAGSSPLRSGASRHRSSDDEGHPGPARTPDSPLLPTSAIVST